MASTESSATNPEIEAKEQPTAHESDVEENPGESERTLDRQLKCLEQLRYQLSPNIYSIIFLSDVHSVSFFYSMACCFAKLSLYSFLAVELGQNGFYYAAGGDRLVQTAQFILLPIAVAIQEDLMESLAVIANVKYVPPEGYPHASAFKWVMALGLRMLDGASSLAINFMLLLQADSVLSLMLNFAALQFLQSIDDMAYSMGKNGYITVKMEYLFNEGLANVTMPRKSNVCTNKLDTLGFLGTTMVLIIGWIIVKLRYEEDSL